MTSEEEEMLKSFVYDNLHAFINKEIIDYSRISSSTQDELYFMMQLHGLHLYMYDTLKLSNIDHFDEDIISRWKQIYTKVTLSLKLQEHQTVDIVNTLSDAGIEVMVLKGIHYASMCKKSYHRDYGDADLYIKPDQYQAAEQVLRNVGYNLSSSEKGLSHHLLYEKKGYVDIELHKLLFLDEKFPDQKNLNQDIFIGARQKAGCNYIIPSPEMDFIYCLFHMYKHYIGMGIGLKHIVDLYHVIKTYDLDWKFIKDKLQAYKMKNFFKMTMMILNQNMYVDLPSCFNWTLDFDLELFKEDIFKSGASGVADGKRLLNNRIADYSNTKKSKGKMQFLFPSQKHLSNIPRYEYCKRSKFYLPVAWTHRVIYNMSVGRIDLTSNKPDNVLIDQRIMMTDWLKEQ